MKSIPMGVVAVLAIAAAPQTPAPDVALATYVGTTPANALVMRSLGAPADAKVEIVEWSLALYQDAKTQLPSRYEWRYAYGLTQPNHPGLARDILRGERRGRWARAAATAPATASEVIELDNGLSLARFDALLHVLSRERTLMTGNGGWGYTLTRADVTERIETTPVSNASSESYTIQPVATGATVFGVFEGRTPCQGIAREILWPVDASCRKLKWRVTLFKDSATQAPTTYRLEGSLFRSTPSEGRWTLAELGPASKRVRVLRLAASGAGSTLSLFQADDNVVFFLDRQDRLLAGTADFGYTLERRR